MKILAIRGKNLASLEGEFEIDFLQEPLKTAGIFAITGQTGSGKSTILDALCLALFDSTPRNNKPSDGVSIIDVKNNPISQTDCRNILRRGTSDGFAEVDFVSLQGETYRSKWSVRRSRDKIDGKMQSSSINLINLSTSIEEQGSKTELLKRIIELIGLSFDQFTRAVLLAQGDFATFLKAGKNEKAELLEKLTGTDIYSRVSSLIFEKTKDVEKDFSLLNERVKDIQLMPISEFEKIKEENEITLKDIDKENSHINEIVSKINWINELAVLESSLNKAKELLNNAKEEVDKANSRYSFINKIDKAQCVRESYFKILDLSREITSKTELLSNIKLEQDKNNKELNLLDNSVKIAQMKLDGFNNKMKDLIPIIKNARELDVRIDSIKQNYDLISGELRKANNNKNECEKAIKNYNNFIIDMESKINIINTWFSDNGIYKEIIPRIELILNLIEDGYSSLELSKSNELLLNKSCKLLEVDAKKLINLQEEADRLNKLLPAEVASLRAKLTDGKPCPVCGSLHHITTDINNVGSQENELNKAKEDNKEKIELLIKDIDKKKSDIIRLKSIIEEYNNQYNIVICKLEQYLLPINMWRDSFNDKSLVNHLKEINEQWVKNIDLLGKNNNLIIDINSKLLVNQTNFNSLQELIFAKEKQCEDNASELSTLINQRSILLEGKSADVFELEMQKEGENINEDLKNINQKKDSLSSNNEKFMGSIAQIDDDIIKTSSLYTTQINELDKWILTQDGEFNKEDLDILFANSADWVNKERSELSLLKDNLNNYNAMVKEREGAITSHHNKSPKPNLHETLDILNQQQYSLKESIVNKSKRVAEINILINNQIEGEKKIKVIEEELNIKKEILDNWKKLNDLLGSADGAKFRVLAQGYTLDALLSYANIHLQELSKRYRLQRIPSSLALGIEDLDLLGEIRSVHSLSGGESFIISLALALGLSSLSSNRMKVESLFIDEGFGSLDIDTLRVAMDALEQLQNQGRKIGVISHVGEMTERITTQIKVIKAINGKSYIKVE